MLKAILARFRQGHRTFTYPDAPLPLPPRFRGLPLLDVSRCDDGCRVCATACPYGAISAPGPLTLDMGKCLFCGDLSTSGKPLPRDCDSVDTQQILAEYLLYLPAIFL